MKPRSAYTIDGSGRLFTRRSLEAYRADLCRELNRAGKAALARRYCEISLAQFAAIGGYVIVR